MADLQQEAVISLLNQQGRYLGARRLLIGCGSSLQWRNLDQ